MSLKVIAQFFKDLWANIKKVLNSRVIPIVAIMVVLFSIMVYRLFYLQIINGESYKTSYTMKTQREVTVNAPRGNIYDRNGELLAYSELAYSVVIEDCGYYESSKIKNKTLNEIIAKTIDIVEDNGDTFNYNLPIERVGLNNYAYTVEGNTLLKFLRDVLGYKSIADMSDTEKDYSAKQLVELLCKRYQIDSNNYNPDTILKMIYVRYNLAANSYKRYISFTIAQNVSPVTMATILESSSELIGVGIEEEYIRKYNYSEPLAHIIGYTGRINESELDELKLINPDYSANDIIGKSGIESTYETTLSGKKGKITMLVDTVGRVQEVTDEVSAVVGNDVYLTIDAKLEEELYHLLERRIAESLYINIFEGDDRNAPGDGQVIIPVKDVYYAMINNGLIDINKIKESDTVAAQTAYSLFSSRKETVKENIIQELNEGTPLNQLPDQMKEYIKRVRSHLFDLQIFNEDKISSKHELSQKWSSGNISLRDYLISAIDNDWININNLNVKDNYPTVEEVTNVLINLVIDEIDNDLEFERLIYKELIMSRALTGKNVCLILMEQGAVEYTESEYVAISNGASAYNFVREKLKNLSITPQSLALDPCSGSCVVENPNNGQLLAIVTYPSYDNNMMSGVVDADYYKKLLSDKSSPLVNRATQTRIAPGSTFKPLVAIASLTEGVVKSDELVYCSGIFEEITPNIKCWRYPLEHGPLDTEAGLQNSCNVYFCEMGYRLSITPSGSLNFEYGLSRLKKYGELFGLATKSGIEIPEATPHPSDYNSVASAMGQGTNMYTSLNLARYTSTVANRGTVYNSTLIYKIVSNDGTIIKDFEPIISNKIEEVSDATWNTVHNGMERVIKYGIMDQFTKDLPVSATFGKSGTAQEDKTRPDHACFIMFTKDKDGNPDIVTSVMLPYSYASTNAGLMAYYALGSYYGIDMPSNIFFEHTTALIIND